VATAQNVIGGNTTVFGVDRRSKLVIAEVLEWC
jgi:hypothetical protein